MYIPVAFAESDLTTLHDFIERHGFGLLCSQHDSTPLASHIPLLIDRTLGAQGTLRGHMARANSQWRLAAQSEVLAVFSGPHAYISPTWYEADDVVPTWNYVAVHVYGTLRLVEDPEALMAIVRDTVTFYERSQPQPWTISGSREFLDRMLQAIVGFTIEITRIEGKWKLNQNQPAQRRRSVVAALRAKGGEMASEMAALVEKTLGGG
jgi:transcriptional regulator